MDDEIKSEFQLLVKALDQLLAKQEKLSQLVTKLAQSETEEIMSIKQIIASDVEIKQEVADLGKLVK
jgi:hypothetical protein